MLIETFMLAPCNQPRCSSMAHHTSYGDSAAFSATTKIRLSLPSLETTAEALEAARQAVQITNLQTAVRR